MAAVPVVVLTALAVLARGASSPEPLPAAPAAAPAAALLGNRHPLTNATGRDMALATFNVSATGAIEMMIEGQKVTVTSTFSSLGQQSSFGGHSNTTTGWAIQIDRPRDGVVRLRGTGSVFSVERWVVGESGRLLVNDTIQVLQAPPADSNATAVEQSHSASFLTPGTQITSVDGPNNEYSTECTSESVGMYGNPSVFMSAADAAGAKHFGIGLLALDDVFGLHARAVNAAKHGPISDCDVADPPAVRLEDVQFGLQGPDASHTVEWAVHAVGSGCTTDPYFCFINGVRADLGVNELPIEGNGVLNAMRWGTRLQPLSYGDQDWRTWSVEKMGEFLDTNKFDWLASDIPWTARQNLCEPGNPHYAHGSGFVTDVSDECMQYIRDLVKAVKTARPHVKVVIYFHAFLSGEANASLHYPDDRILDDAGNQICWDSSGCVHACEEAPYFFGTMTNEYGRMLDAYIEKVFALGADGIYHVRPYHTTATTNAASQQITMLLLYPDSYLDITIYLLLSTVHTCCLSSLSESTTACYRTSLRSRWSASTAKTSGSCSTRPTSSGTASLSRPGPRHKDRRSLGSRQ